MLPTNSTSPLSFISRNATLFLLLFIAVIILTANLGGYPAVWFDEGYKANGARTLAEDGIYGTYTTNGYIPFDPGLSSGPVDMSLMALTFSAFGRGVIQMRVSSVMLTLLALVALYAIARQLYGHPAGLLIALFVVAFPVISDTGFLLIGRQALSEPAALALILTGLALWFAGWDQPRWYVGFAAGLIMGLGLLSKTQYAIALLPAVFITSAAYSYRRRTHLVYFGVTLATVMLVIVAWMSLGRLLTPVDIAQENSAMLLDAIQTNLITGLWGRTLSNHALVIIGVMSLGVISAGVRLRRTGLQTSANWAEVCIVLFVAVTIIWHALFSIGWPRYAYAGLVLGLLLVGKFAYDLLVRWLPQLTRRPAALAALLIVAALVIHVVPVWSHPYSDSGAEAFSDYVDTHVAPEAVIETWEWELTALSNHKAFHLPHQRYLFEAIRQFSHEQLSEMHLSYDPLQANPDYLITGPFSKFTNIYDSITFTDHFRHVITIGDYDLYERIQET